MEGRQASFLSGPKWGCFEAPVEELTISIDDTAAGATLRIEWGTTSATANFKVSP